MPIIKSAIKRVRQQAKRQRRNNIVRNKFKTLSKEFVELVKAGDTKKATELYPALQKSIDMAAKKNIMNKNTASRRKSVLAKMLAK